MRSHHLGKRSGFLRDLAAIAREAAVEVREASDPDGVVMRPVSRAARVVEHIAVVWKPV